MRTRRSRSGFRRAGDLAAGRLGLSATRTRELALTGAWHDVAGPAVARRVHAVRIHRGVLELRVEHARWAEALAPLVPRLAARLAARHPDLGVKRLRLMRPGDTRSTRADALPELAREAEPAGAPARREDAGAETSSDAGDPGERLRRAASRALARRDPPP